MVKRSLQGPAMARADSGMPFTAEARVQIRNKLCGSCGKSSTGTDFSPSASVFPCQYHFSNLSSLFLIIYTLN